jgi:hypothetical protein
MFILRVYSLCLMLLPLCSSASLNQRRNAISSESNQPIGTDMATKMPGDVGFEHGTTGGQHDGLHSTQPMRSRIVRHWRLGSRVTTLEFDHFLLNPDNCVNGLCCMSYKPCYYTFIFSIWYTMLQSQYRVATAEVSGIPCCSLSTVLLWLKYLVYHAAVSVPCCCGWSLVYHAVVSVPCCCGWSLVYHAVVSVPCCCGWSVWYKCWYVYSGPTILTGPGFSGDLRLKGTAAQDFRSLDFSISRTHLGPVIYIPK